MLTIYRSSTKYNIELSFLDFTLLERNNDDFKDFIPISPGIVRLFKFR